jgi:PAS domain S-box-containing protein
VTAASNPDGGEAASEAPWSAPDDSPLWSIFDAAPDALVVVDARGRIRMANAQVRHVFGYAPAELVDRPVELLAPGAARERHAELRRRYQSDPRARPMGSGLELDAIRKDGSAFAAEISLSPTRMSGTPLVIAAIRDVSERRRAAEQIRRLNAELEERVARRTAELAAANTELEAFTYSVSHDLRSPLRSIKGFSELLLRDLGPTLPPAVRGDLERIDRAAARMSALIDGLLGLARVDRMTASRRPIALSEVAARILGDLLPPERRAEIRVAPGLVVRADPALMEALLQNLLGNAVKFTAGVPVARIEVGARGEGPDRIYFVKDNGAGFDMAYAGKLFSAFQRLHGADEFEGHGIGLATVKRIVARHGGRVWAEGVVGVGATVSFTMPDLGEPGAAP